MVTPKQRTQQDRLAERAPTVENRPRAVAGSAAQTSRGPARIWRFGRGHSGHRPAGSSRASAMRGRQRRTVTPRCHGDPHRHRVRAAAGRRGEPSCHFAGPLQEQSPAGSGWGGGATGTSCSKTTGFAFAGSGDFRSVRVSVVASWARALLGEGCLVVGMELRFSRDTPRQPRRSEEVDNGAVRADQTIQIPAFSGSSL